jgi:hypothetical protein
MNIIWNIKTSLESQGGTEFVKVAPQDVWQGISLSEPILNVLKGTHTVDITRNESIFKSIPTNWYLVEH